MRSMTGYGQSRSTSDGRDLLLELKAVNHRYLDVSFRLPKTLNFLEEPLRAALAGLQRGHIDVSVNYQNTRVDAVSVSLDHNLLHLCDTEVRNAAIQLGLPTASVAELIQLSGALTVTQQDEDRERVTALALEAFAAARTQLDDMRAREGAALADDLREKLAQARACVDAIGERAPIVPAKARERLLARLAEWDAQTIEPQRVAQEIALLADRCAIDEELSRLRSHFSQFEACVAAEDAAGRRLDFLLQEMNREINTIGSKANDAEIASRVVEVKCLLEKLREQVQNVL